MELPESYRAEMKALLGDAQYGAYLDSLEKEPAYGIRFNPLKVKKSICKSILFSLKIQEEREVFWSDGVGFYYEKDKNPARHPYYYAGLYYLQEPSAMAPGAFLPVSYGDRVLDLCAAPGGKSTQLGARLAGSGFLLSNDISASRAKGLLKNLELFGIGNCLVSSEEPEKLLAFFPEYFDKILVDAPCSGEGMFRRDPSMIKSWLEKGPDFYSRIQKHLLFTACRMLRPGGMILYSTCTFAKKEDEDVIKYVLEEMPDMEQVTLPESNGLVHGFDGASLRLFPWRLGGEGHFLSLLRKKICGENSEKQSGDILENMVKKRRKEKNEKFLKEKEGFSDFLKLVKRPLAEEGFFWEREGQIYLLPISKEELPPLRFLRTGLLLGTIKKNRFEPSQAFAMYLKKEEFVNGADFSSEDMRCIKYLKGETIEDNGADSWGDDGWCLVCTDGYPLGFAKRNKKTLKNKYYPGWRWQ